MAENLLEGNEQIKKYLTAGNATFTISNEKTGNRFTFKVSAHKEQPLFFVNVLTGSNNETDYTNIGIINEQFNFFRSKRSPISASSITFKAFNWLWSCITKNIDLPESVHCRHEGRCGRCGRKLTTPDSIDAGFGPECIKFV